MQIKIFGSDERNRRSLLKRLFEKNYEKVYRKAYMLLFDTEMAKDATQEVFLRAYEKIDTLKDIDRLEVWVYTIVRNTCRNMLRDKRFRNKNIVLYDNEQEINYNLDGSYSNGIPEKILEDKELGNELHTCIYQLDKIDQHIILLRMHFDFTYKEIAQHLGLNESTVKSRAQRAKGKIFHKLREYWNRKE